MNTRTVIRVSGDGLKAYLFLWGILGFVILFPLAFGQDFSQGKAGEYLLHFLVPVISVGAILTLITMGINWILASSLYFDGNMFHIDSPGSGKSFSPGEIRSYGRTFWRKPAVYEIMLKNERRVRIIAPLWLFQAEERDSFVEAVQRRYQKERKKVSATGP